MTSRQVAISDRLGVHTCKLTIGFLLLCRLKKVSIKMGLSYKNNKGAPKIIVIETVYKIFVSVGDVLQIIKNCLGEKAQ